MLEAIIEDKRLGIPVETIAGKFHNALARAIADLASFVGESRVVLSGGCFQNQLAVAAARLRAGRSQEA